MTSIRVIDDHGELEGVGVLSHPQIDSYFLSGAFTFVSGVSGPLPPAARLLKFGTGITVVDEGPGGNLVVNVTSAQSISWNEVPAGSNDGVNKTFTFSQAPSPPSALMLFINGVKQRMGIDSDYTVTGSIVNLTPQNGYRSGSNIDATYPY